MHLKIPEADRKDASKYLEAYFKSPRNVFYERFAFNLCVQRDETVNSFANKLRKLAAPCKYGELTDELIRDRLIIGLKDTNLKARLLRQKDLDLAKALQLCTSSEIAGEQLRKMQNDESRAVEEVRKMEFSRRRQHQRPPKYTHKPPKADGKTAVSSLNKCNYCGGTHKRDREHCPAYGATCKNCNKQHHFAKVCKKKAVHLLTDNGDQYNICSDESVFGMESVGTVKSAGSRWYVTLQLSADHKDHSRKVVCQMDCGSTCKVINFKEYCRIIQDG